MLKSEGPVKGHTKVCSSARHTLVTVEETTQFPHTDRVPLSSAFLVKPLGTSYGPVRALSFWSHFSRS